MKKCKKRATLKGKKGSKQEAFDTFADDSGPLIGIIKVLMPLLGNLIALDGFADMEE